MPIPPAWKDAVPPQARDWSCTASGIWKAIEPANRKPSAKSSSRLMYLRRLSIMKRVLSLLASCLATCGRADPNAAVLSRTLPSLCFDSITFPFTSLTLVLLSDCPIQNDAACFIQDVAVDTLATEVSETSTKAIVVCQSCSAGRATTPCL